MTLAHRRSSVRRLTIAVALAFGLLGMVAAPAPAQGVLGRAAPTDIYLGYFGAFHDGNYVDALKGFMDEGRGGIKTAQSNWIDSICYHAMVGECYYQMGQLPQALAHYNSALQLYIAFYDWLIRVQFQGIMPANMGQIRACPWGVRQRTTMLGRFPDVMSSLQGQVGTALLQNQSGNLQAVPTAQAYPIRPIEILRCTCLAIRRRGELLGPLGEHDALGKEVLAALARRPTLPNHWSEAWIDVQLGLAYAAVGKIEQAKPILQRSLIVGGEFDHPLTSIALFELGRIALLQSDYQNAAKYFEEASYAAYYYEDPGLLEEIFRHGLTNHLMSGRPDLYPPLLNAATWAKAAGLRQLHVSCSLLAAENLAAMGEEKQAQAMFTQARAATANRPMLRGKIGARLNYLLALLMYQSGQTADGDAAIANLMTYERASSHWLFQITTADNLYLEGALSPRSAVLVYQRLLHEPDGFDWAYDPIETLAVLCTPHSQSYENWFLTALERDKSSAFEVADEVRRHRFLSTLPLGGRLVGLRWLLEGPTELLDQKSVLDKQTLLTRFPAYDPLSQKARALQAALAQMPLVAEADDQRQQQQAVAELAEVSLEQERVLREMAIRRNPGGLLFPPKRSLKNIQASLSDGQALLAFLTTSAGVYGFLVKSNDYDVYPIDSAANLHRKITQLLRDMGNTDGNREIGYDQLQSPKWKRSASELFEALSRNIKSNFPEGIEELVIVPDRSLWYVPFAALQVGGKDASQPLLGKMRLRFAPTAGLAVGDSRGQKQQMSTLVVLGKLAPKQKVEVTQELFAELSQAVPGAVALASKPPAPSDVYVSTVGRLVVLDDIEATSGGEYDWSPLQVDHGNDGSTLSDWMMLPWSGPDQVLLPGFHSAGENSLKGQSMDAAGDELFFGVCGLMASGARTVLISQWRTGGQTSFDLMREFVQEVPHSGAADAWQRAVALAREAKLDPAREPRLAPDKKHEPPTADHPFFWAGYLLIDAGPSGQKPDKPDVGVAMNAPAAKGDEPEQPRGANPAPLLGGGADQAAPIGGVAEGAGGQFDGGRDVLGSKGKKGKKKPNSRPSRVKKKPAQFDESAEG